MTRRRSTRTAPKTATVPPTWSTIRADGTKSYGPSVRARLADVGVVLLPWQADTLDEWLEVDDAGNLTRKTCGVVVPRRNGKTLLILARVLAGMLWLDERRWVYSAHLADSAREAFRTMDTITRHPKLASRVTRRLRAEGREELHFDSGARFVIRTRTGHGGRGLECDGLVLDEALVCDEDSVAALTPLTAKAARRGRGQVVYASSAGTLTSTVLTGLRDRGRAAHGTTGDGLSYREFGMHDTDDPTDEATWAKANPSLGTSLLDVDFLRAAAIRLRPDAFRREHLGQWGDAAELPLVDPDAWAALATTTRPDQSPESGSWITFDLAPDRSSARVLRFYRTTDAKVAVMTLDAVDDPRGLDDDLYAARVIALIEQWQPDVLGYDALTGSQVAAVLTNLGWKGRLRKITGTLAASGCASLAQAVKSGTVIHDGNPDVAADLARAIPKAWGDGGQVFGRKASVTGSIAAAIALGAGFALRDDDLVV